MQVRQYVFTVVIFFAVLVLVLELIHFLAVKKKVLKLEDASDCWKWGIIYFNPDDPRIIVPKRIEWMGWTLNFAQPISMIIIGGLILFIILIKVLAK